MLQKSLLFLLAIGLRGVICAPDISHLNSANSHQGYDYPKPKIPFEEPKKPVIV